MEAKSGRSERRRPSCSANRGVGEASRQPQGRRRTRHSHPLLPPPAAHAPCSGQHFLPPFPRRRVIDTCTHTAAAAGGLAVQPAAPGADAPPAVSLLWLWLWWGSRHACTARTLGCTAAVAPLAVQLGAQQPAVSLLSPCCCRPSSGPSNVKVVSSCARASAPGAVVPLPRGSGLDQTSHCLPAPLLPPASLLLRSCCPVLRRCIATCPLQLVIVHLASRRTRQRHTVASLV